MQTWKAQNPELEMRLQSDVEAAAFIHETLGASTLAMYRAFPLGVMRADFWHYAVLFARGGIYADVDTTCEVPAVDWLPPRDGGAAGMPFEAQYNATTWQDCSVVIALENNAHFVQWVSEGGSERGQWVCSE